MRTIYSPRGTYASTNRNAAHPVASINTPSLDVVVFGQKGTFGAGRDYDLTNDVLGIIVDKNFQAPLGQATITAKVGVTGAGAASSWLDLLRPMDMVLIRASGTGPDLRTIFVGYIVSVEEVMDASRPGQEQRYITITAVDLMLGLVQPQLTIPSKNTYLPADQYGRPVVQKWSQLFDTLTRSAFNPDVADLSPNSWLLLFLGQLQGGKVSSQSMSPTELIHQLMVHVVPVLFSPVTHVSLPSHVGDHTWADFINLALCSTLQFSTATWALGPFDGSLMEIMRSFTNPPFYEFFGDVRSSDQTQDLGIPLKAVSGHFTQNPVSSLGPDGAQFYITVRETPFGASNWSKLIPFTLAPEDVVSYRLGLFQNNVVNYYMAYPEALNQELYGATTRTYPALGDADSILTYGFRPLIVPLYGLYTDDELKNAAKGHTGAFDINRVNSYEQKLYEWYWKNPDMLSGSVVIRGNPFPRVGMKFQAGWWPLEGYIEGVRHEIVVMDHYTTTLTVSRGTKPGTYTPPTLQTRPIVG